MLLFSENFGINKDQNDLNFVNINLESDNKLFVDPRLIDINPLFKNYSNSISLFWCSLLETRKSKSFKKSEYLLKGLKEPKETMLGYGNGRNGKSIAEILRNKLIYSINSNENFFNGLTKSLSDLEFFIKDISSDRLSDMTTKIVYEDLILFTQEQCVRYNITMFYSLQEYFDFNNFKWINKRVLLPHYQGKPIVLIPKQIVNSESKSNRNLSIFYRYAIKMFVLFDEDINKEIEGTGKDGKILAKDIKERFPLTKDLIMKWNIKYPTLLVDFQSNYFSSYINCLSDSEIVEIVCRKKHDAA